VAGLLRAAAVVGPAQSAAVVAATAPLLAQRLWLCDAAQMACPLVRAAMLDLLELTSTTTASVSDVSSDSDSSASGDQHEPAVASASDALRKATAQVHLLDNLINGCFSLVCALSVLLATCTILQCNAVHWSTCQGAPLFCQWYNTVRCLS
jgi:hypothetical protein